jgi:hypothetical protein
VPQPLLKERIDDVPDTVSHVDQAAALQPDDRGRDAEVAREPVQARQRASAGVRSLNFRGGTQPMN